MIIPDAQLYSIIEDSNTDFGVSTIASAGIKAQYIFVGQRIDKNNSKIQSFSNLSNYLFIQHPRGHLCQ